MKKDRKKKIQETFLEALEKHRLLNTLVMLQEYLEIQFIDGKKKAFGLKIKLRKLCSLVLIE